MLNPFSVRFLQLSPAFHSNFSPQSLDSDVSLHRCVSLLLIPLTTRTIVFLLSLSLCFSPRTCCLPPLSSLHPAFSSRLCGHVPASKRGGRQTRYFGPFFKWMWEIIRWACVYLYAYHFNTLLISIHRQFGMESWLTVPKKLPENNLFTHRSD